MPGLLLCSFGQLPVVGCSSWPLMACGCTLGVVSAQVSRCCHRPRERWRHICRLWEMVYNCLHILHACVRDTLSIHLACRPLMWCQSSKGSEAGCSTWPSRAIGWHRGGACTSVEMPPQAQGAPETRMLAVSGRTTVCTSHMCVPGARSAYIWPVDPSLMLA
jgi:hypothetical protein